MNRIAITFAVTMSIVSIAIGQTTIEDIVRANEPIAKLAYQVSQDTKPRSTTAIDSVLNPSVRNGRPGWLGVDTLAEGQKGLAIWLDAEVVAIASNGQAIVKLHASQKSGRNDWRYAVLTVPQGSLKAGDFVHGHDWKKKIGTHFFKVGALRDRTIQVRSTSKSTGDVLIDETTTIPMISLEPDFERQSAIDAKITKERETEVAEIDTRQSQDNARKDAEPYRYNHIRKWRNVRTGKSITGRLYDLTENRVKIKKGTRTISILRSQLHRDDLSNARSDMSTIRKHRERIALASRSQNSVGSTVAYGTSPMDVPVPVRKWINKKTQEIITGKLVAVSSAHIRIRTDEGLVSIRKRDLHPEDLREAEVDLIAIRANQRIHGK